MLRGWSIYLPFGKGINILRSINTVFCALHSDYTSYKHTPTKLYCLKQDGRA